MLKLKVFRLIFGVLRVNNCMCSLGQDFLYKIFIYYLECLYNIWISVRLLKKCLNVFGIKGVEKEVCMKLFGKMLFCIIGVPTLNLIQAARTKVF